MSKIQVYDKAMCCSTGVCGPQVDPVLPRFAADLDWLQRQGHEVERFNLAQDPAQFAKNPTVQQMLQSEGVDCLPLIIVDDRVVSRSEYSSRQNLAMWTETKLPGPLPTVASKSDDCCGNSGCC
ncbi:MAG: arsenite efflux transporter metallochaperone ArsD [Rubripirellula sp.]